MKYSCIVAIVTVHYFLRDHLHTLQIKDMIDFEERLYATEISDGSCTTRHLTVKLN